jgi:hypothetical protein
MRTFCMFFLFLLLATGCGPNHSNNLYMVKSQFTKSKLRLEMDRTQRLRFFVEDDSGKMHRAIWQMNGSITIEQSSGVLLYDSKSLGVEPIEIGRVDPSAQYAEICNDSFAMACRISLGYKLPNDYQEGSEAIYTIKLVLQAENRNSSDDTSRVTELLELALPSPDQEEGGTCLYMASTGAMEILLNKDLKRRDLQSEGSTDLSERFLMNAGQDWQLENWKTDTILLFNHERGAILNRDFRYTKGWTKSNGGNLVAANPSTKGAQYSTHFNWVYDLNETIRAQKIPTPKVKRTILFEDEENDLWNTGVMDRSIITKVKRHLREKKTPVMAIYNHYGYWHAALILGFDDTVEHEECSFAKSFIEEMKNEPIQKQHIEQIQEAMKSQGGCSTKGVFYVRDSIYEGNPSNVYDYDLTIRGEEKPYSKKIVEHEYEWLLYMGNHAYTIELQ